MGVTTIEVQVVSAIPVAKMFKAYILDVDTILPKAMPQIVENVAIVEGNGGPGTIKQFTFGEGSKFKQAKERIDSIDTEKFTFASTIIESDGFGNLLEKVTKELKFEASPDGGTICKIVNKCYPIGDLEIPEDKAKDSEEISKGTFKAVEAYLLVNPDA